MILNSIIIGKMVTEKTSKMEKNNVYGFYVHKASSKHKVEEAIDMMYGQRPTKVNIVKRPKTPRRAGKKRIEIYDEGRKIAYVTLAKPLGKISQKS